MYLIIQQQQQLMEHPHLINLLRQIDDKGYFNQYLNAIEQQYLIKIYKITSLTTNNIFELYSILQKKFYINRKSDNEEFWYENQLRIFIYLLFAYLYVNEKLINDLKEDDWKYFSTIFNHKDAYFFEFQSLSIMKPKIRPAPWCEEQINILESIINEKKYKNRWNSIARELFIKSGRRFFRNPKQCRERWMNHLDPTKIHSEWTPNQDLILLNTIKKKGKKWSVAVKELNNTRTQHMVKNRYKSLISNESKKNPQKNQSDLQRIIIKRLTKSQQKVNKMDTSKHQNIGNNKINNLSPNFQQINEIKLQYRQQLSQLDIMSGINQSNNESSQRGSQKYANWREEQNQLQQVNFMEDQQVSISDHLCGQYSLGQNEHFLKF